MTSANKLARQMVGGSVHFVIMKNMLIAVAHNDIGRYDLDNDVYSSCISYLERCHAVKQFSFTWKLTDFGKDIIKEINLLEK